MNDIRDLFPGRMRERTFQLKAKRDAGAVWHEQQFVECKQCGRRAARTLWARSLYVCPNCGWYQGRQAVELKPAGDEIVAYNGLDPASGGVAFATNGRGLLGTLAQQ